MKPLSFLLVITLSFFTVILIGSQTNANPQLKVLLTKLEGKNNVQVGVAKINATVPIGCPLAGYNHGDRRVPHWPIPQFKKYTTFMSPSKGIVLLDLT